MKRRSRQTKKENPSKVVKSSNLRSEENLRGNRFQGLHQKKQSSSETSLLLYKQLNKVIDVLKYDFNTKAEGPTLIATPFIRVAADKDSRTKMADAPRMSLEEEIKSILTEVEQAPDIPTKKKILEEEQNKLTKERDEHRKEIQELEDTTAKVQKDLEDAEDDEVKDNLTNQLTEINENKTKLKEELSGLVRAISQVTQAFANLEEKEKEELAKKEVIDEDELETTTDEEEGIPRGAEAIVVAPAFVDNAPGGAPASSGTTPPGPPPTPDGKKDEADFPLYDNAVLTELQEADERAAKASKAIEAVREQLAVYAKKDEMTDEDIKMMEEKQKELMAKMQEFEEITKKVQYLVGLVDVASSQLGPPQKQMLPNLEGERPPGTGASSQPEDTLPKVIVCGTGDIDQVPKIIVCEPTKARDGKHPLYHQIQGKQKEGTTSKTGIQETASKTAMGQGSGYPPGTTSGYPGSPSGYPGAQGGWPGPPGSPGGYPGTPGGWPGPPGSQGGYPGSQGGYPGSPGGYPGYPGGMGGYPGQTFPGSGIYGMGGAGMPGYPGPGMVGPQGTMLPGGMPVPICGPCQPNKPKKHKSHKKKETCPAVCPENCHELGEMLEATLNMTDKLAEQNTELEGSRYELQEAVLNKEKQYDGLALQLDSMKMELKNVKNENTYLKNMVAKNAQCPGAQGDQLRCGEKAGMKKTGGLCRKDLNTMPMCKAQAYKEMGLAIPRPDNKPPCPGAKFAASMGWNENQGCRNELSKSVNCPDMQGASGNTCSCTTKGPSQCPMHGGRSVNPTRPQNLGSGDVGGSNCPCGCLGQVAQCKKADMEAVVQTMEQEVKSLQKELELVQAERRGLALQKKLLNCMADTGTGGAYSGARSLDDSPSAGMRSQPPPNKPLVLLQKPTPENLSAVELQLNSLREQYRKLQEDYNAKVEEVSMVRVEYEAAKRDALALLEKCREAEARVDDLLERLRIIELEKNKMAGSKDQMMELDQQLIIAKQRYREGQEELEEIKTTMQDQMLQLEEYRNKYLTAQQTVEEQRRQIDIMELENNRISEQVNLEIQRVKTQFQEKLQELTPLPDMLKATQLKLQECDQLRQLAERNVEQLLNQVDDIKDQNKKLESELEELKKNSATQNAERSNLTSSLSTGEKKIEEIKSENNKLRATVARLEEVALNNDRRLDEKNHEVLQLQTQLETLREESARQVSRTKDRCEAVRRTLQSQISQLETQLAQSRAAARTAQKDRDEIRQRMQAQITSLNDNFEQAQLRIRSLQSHVNYLKSSYTNIFAPEHSIGPKQIDGLSTC